MYCRLPRTGRRRRRGFTLIEIMLVMVILSVLAGTIVANMQEGYGDAAIEADTDTLVSVIHAAQH